MEQKLEEKLEQTVSPSWVRRAYAEEWPTMGNHLVACGVAIGSASGFSHVAPELIESDAAISGIATVIDAASYWGTLLPQLIFRDRKKLKNENGDLDRRKIVKKAGEYLGYMGIIEGAYTAIRFAGQYALQKRGWDPGTASAAIQIGATALFTFALPPIRYAVRQWSEK
jgi:hypothetical protein